MRKNLQNEWDLRPDGPKGKGRISGGRELTGNKTLYAVVKYQGDVLRLLSHRE